MVRKKNTDVTFTDVAYQDIHLKAKTAHTADR